MPIAPQCNTKHTILKSRTNTRTTHSCTHIVIVVHGACAEDLHLLFSTKNTGVTPAQRQTPNTQCMPTVFVVVSGRFLDFAVRAIRADIIGTSGRAQTPVCDRMLQLVCLFSGFVVRCPDTCEHAHNASVFPSEFMCVLAFVHPCICVRLCAWHPCLLHRQEHQCRCDAFEPQKCVRANIPHIRGDSSGKRDRVQTR